MNLKFQCILDNILHVPIIIKNLLSVSQYAIDNQDFFEFHPNYCLVKSQNSYEIVLKGVLDKDGPYKFPSMLSQ